MIGLPSILRSGLLTLVASIALSGLVACGGGGSTDSGSLSSAGSNAGPGGDGGDLASLFTSCYSADMAELTGILELFQGVVGEGGELDPAQDIPLPEFDLLGGLLNGGEFSYTWDLNGDDVSDVSGTLRFIDANGATTLPINVVDLLLNPPESIEDVLGLVTGNARLEFGFELGSLLLSGGTDASGAGKLVFGLFDGAIETVSGSGTFESGPCLLDFSFDDIAISLTELDGIPAATFDFDASVGENSLHGSFVIGLDGVATVTAQLNDDPEETFEIDLNALEEIDFPAPAAE
jgi:hypothetical protein